MYDKIISGLMLASFAALLIGLCALGAQLKW